MNENLFRTDVAIRTPEDWRSVRPITGKESYVQDQLDIVKALADEIGHEAYLYTTIHGIFASAFHATGDSDDKLARNDKLTAHLKESPEIMISALKNIAEGIAIFTQLCIEAGSHGIYYAALGAEKYRFSKEMFNDFIKPNDLLILDSAANASAGVVLHMCKDSLNIDMYKDYPVEIVNWAVHENNPALSEGRRIFPQTILGGFDDREGELVHGSSAQIAEKVSRLIAEMGSEKFIVGADCTLPTEIEYSRVRGVVDAVRSI
ncbi:uroporphyrinogen decarboxylase family protein [Alkalispirochaeta alkalica]